jgi:monomeric isocitrate dehydrogenase
LEVLYLLIYNWAELYMSAQASDYDKRQFLAKSVDSAIEKYVTELSPYREATDLLNRYKALSKMIFTRR